MGNETENVSQANTEKATYDKIISNMKNGVCEMQGWRKTMEDAAIVLPNFEKNTSLFGILDGHGGSIISEFVSVNFKNILIRTDSYKNGNYEKALTETFLIIDELLKNKKINNFIYTTHNSKEKVKGSETSNKTNNQNSNENIVKLRFETGIYEFDLNQIDLSIGGEDTSTTIYEYKYKGNTALKNESSTSTHSKTSLDNFVANEMGTTANIMLIKNGIIYIANVGDSLSVMYKNKKAYNLNREHQTIIESEKERVLKSGANIIGYRINGMLNLTRAIGDLQFKSNSNLKRHEQSVIAIPEITKIEDTDGIDFIIMGCDGVWDCVKRQLVCDFVDRKIKENPDKDLSDILKVIFDRCVSPVSGVLLGTDNMSCMIIQFLHNEQKNGDNIIIKKVNINEEIIENIDKENILKN